MHQAEPQSARTEIDELIAGLDDLRGDRLSEVRQAIHDALPEDGDVDVDGEPGVGAGRHRRHRRRNTDRHASHRVASFLAGMTG